MKALPAMVVVALAPWVYAQMTHPAETEWSSKSKRAAEGIVAKKIDDMRAHANRPRLRRAKPSIREVELVCTAALTGRETGDPVMGGLGTYQTDDLSLETDVLKEMTVGKFYPKKKWPRYSVIVERNASLGVYTVGIARRPSALMEFFAPLMFDVPFKGMNEWKKTVTPECRKRGTNSSNATESP